MSDEMPQPDPPIQCVNIRQTNKRVTSLELALIRERAIEGTATAEDAEKLERVLMEALDRLGREHDEREAVVRRAENAEAAIARVRRLCDLTIGASIRVQAINQARDTLAVLDQSKEKGDPEADRAERLLAELEKRAEQLAVALPDLIRVAAYVSRGRSFVDTEPYPDALARRALGALDDATIRAALDQPQETP